MRNLLITFGGSGNLPLKRAKCGQDVQTFLFLIKNPIRPSERCSQGSAEARGRQRRPVSDGKGPYQLVPLHSLATPTVFVYLFFLNHSFVETSGKNVSTPHQTGSLISGGFGSPQKT